MVNFTQNVLRSFMTYRKPSLEVDVCQETALKISMRKSGRFR